MEAITFTPRLTRSSHDGREFFEGTQFDIDQSRVREETGEEFPSLGKTKAVRPSLRRVPDRNDQRDSQAGQHGQQGGGIVREIIDADFQEIHLAGLDPERSPKSPWRMHGGHHLRHLT